MPRRAVPVILIDGGDGVAERAASRLEAIGYTDVSTIDGGTQAWRAAGYTLFKGVNVPSKTLGELAEQVFHPRMIDAETLRQWKAEGRDFAFYDTRPPDEYRKMRVPGAVCLPNGELAHRHDAVRRDPSRPILITCAGRTRGLIGWAGLTLAGIDNVYALENGTQGWALAGETLERGNEVGPYPALSPDQAAASAARAEDLAARHAIPFIDAAAFASLAADRERTLYLFDVRSAEEYAAGHVEGAVHAVGVQLVQSTDQWVGVRNARIVLADDTGLRAAIAAYWLARLGYEIFVLRAEDAAGLVHANAGPAAPRAAAKAVAAGSLGAAGERRDHPRPAVLANPSRRRAGRGRLGDPSAPRPPLRRRAARSASPRRRSARRVPRRAGSPGGGDDEHRPDGGRLRGLEESWPAGGDAGRTVRCRRHRFPRLRP